MLSLDYAKLWRVFRKGIRKNNWRNLRSDEKGLFRAAIAYTKIGGWIKNLNLLRPLHSIIKKLTSSLKRRIWQKGIEKAHEMRRHFEDKGVFDWCPQARGWFKNLYYIFYLGVSSVNSEWWGGRI